MNTQPDAGTKGRSAAGGGPAVSIIAAMSENRVIGRDGDLPWRLPDDWAFFKRTTLGHPVITGRRNFECMRKPLADRLNIVVSRRSGYRAKGAEVVGSLDEAIALARQHDPQEVFIIGGGQIYAEAIRRNLADRMYLTVVRAQVEGDTRFPEFEEDDWIVDSRQEHPPDPRHEYAFTICRYVRKGG